MNQLRRKGRSKRRNSKLRKSRRKTRVKRQYKWTASRVKRNTYRKNRKRHTYRKNRKRHTKRRTKRRIRGGLLTDKQKQLLAKWNEYQPSEDDYETSRNITPLTLNLGNGVLRKEAEKQLKTVNDVTPGMIQTQMNLYLEEIIQAFPNLRSLDISGNDLQYLPKNFGLLGLSELKSLNIEGNPKLLTDPGSKEILTILYAGREEYNLGEEERIVTIKGYKEDQ